MTHTPGPWERASDKEGDEYALCIVQNKSWRGQQFIARAEPYGAHDGLNEAEANARLIAAAPELLEALEEARAAGFNITRGPRPDWQDIARAAIAKAKGE